MAENHSSVNSVVRRPKKLHVIALGAMALLSCLLGAWLVVNIMSGYKLSLVKRAMAEANGGTMPVVTYDDDGSVSSIEGKFTKRRVTSSADAVAAVGDIAPLLGISNPIKVLEPVREESISADERRYVLRVKTDEPGTIIYVEADDKGGVSRYTVPDKDVPVNTNIDNKGSDKVKPLLDRCAIEFIRMYYDDWTFDGTRDVANTKNITERCLPLIDSDSSLYDEFNKAYDLHTPGGEYYRDYVTCVIEDPVAEQLDDDTFRVTVRIAGTQNSVDKEMYDKMLSGNHTSEVTWDVTLNADGLVTELSRYGSNQEASQKDLRGRYELISEGTGGNSTITVDVTSQEGSYVTFDITYLGRNGSPIYSTAGEGMVVNDAVSFDWSDSWSNSGYGTMTFYDGGINLKMIETASAQRNRWSFGTLSDGKDIPRIS